MRFLLNESTEGEVLSSDGSEFHQVGPMEQNARSPYVTDRVIGTFSSMPAERRPGLALRYWIRSWRYWGAGPCSVLYTSSVTLYCIRDVIGSQWSSRRTGVIWSYLLLLIGKCTLRAMHLALLSISPMCTESVNIILLRSLCTTVYACELWWTYGSESLRKLCVLTIMVLYLIVLHTCLSLEVYLHAIW